MDVTVENYGRIVIPKPLRERLGLTAGSALELSIECDDDGEALTLRPSQQRPALGRRDGVLVHTGKTDGLLDPVDSVFRAREARMRQIAESSR